MNISKASKSKAFASNIYKKRRPWPLIERVLKEMKQDNTTKYMNYNDEFANFNSPMNLQLFNLYETKLKKLYLSLEADIRDNNALPYLIAASQIYEKSKYRIMVVGQESNDWGGEFCYSYTTRDLMRLYDFWINGNGGTTHEHNIGYIPMFQFYANYIKYNFEKGSNCFQPFDVGTIHYNTLLISKRGKGYDENANIFSDEIFRDILNIVRPNCILFLIGNDAKYRERLKKIFQMDFSKELTIDELLQFYPSGNNNPDIFIAGHPGGLYLNSTEHRSKVSIAIQQFIKIQSQKIQP